MGVDLSSGNISRGGGNVVRRSWKHFDPKRCYRTFRDTDWSEILTENNVDVAASRLEEMIREIMEQEAPMKTLQIRDKIQ